MPHTVERTLARFRCSSRRGHDFDEIARPMAVIELVAQDAVPGVAAGTSRARQAEHEGAVGNPGRGARLDRRGADRLEADAVEQRGETLHPLVEQRFDRFRRDIAAGEAGSAGGQNDIDRFIGEPGPHDPLDGVDLVGRDVARRYRMAGAFDALAQKRAGPVFGQRAGIRHSQHRKPHRDERSLAILGQWPAFPSDSLARISHTGHDLRRFRPLTGCVERLSRCDGIALRRSPAPSTA